MTFFKGWDIRPATID